MAFFAVRFPPVGITPENQRLILNRQALPDWTVLGDAVQGDDATLYLQTRLDVSFFIFILTFGLSLFERCFPGYLNRDKN
jgi:hypothetical protein